MELPADTERLCAAFVYGLDAVLGDNLYSAYLYGALTFPEGGAGGDIDYHVVVRQALTGKEIAGLKDLHAALEREFGGPGWDMDGYYILLADACRAAPPRHQFLPGAIDKSWALHRAHFHAGRCLVLRGAHPKEFCPPPAWPELKAALWGELDFVDRYLTEYPDYCALQLCRLMYSALTREVVVSKRFSAGWARAAFPRWVPLIDGALASYDRGHPDDDRQLLAAQIEEYHAFALDHIRAGLGPPEPAGQAP